MATCKIDDCPKDTSKGGKGYCSMHYTRLVRHGDVGPTGGLVERFDTLAERFWAKVDTTGDCWVWTASMGGYGYGQIHVAGRPVGAHRVAWLLEHGSYPPDELELDHLCRNRACVRPAHLEAVDRRTNFLRGEHPTAVAFRAGTCHAGHERSEENTSIRPDGRRECRVCRRLQEASRYARRAAERRTA